MAAPQPKLVVDKWKRKLGRSEPILLADTGKGNLGVTRSILLVDIWKRKLGRCMSILFVGTRKGKLSAPRLILLVDTWKGEIRRSAVAPTREKVNGEIRSLLADPVR